MRIETGSEAQTVSVDVVNARINRLISQLLTSANATVSWP